MKKIKLTNGKYALVDNDMFETVNAIKWTCIKNRNKFYAINSRNGKIHMHRLIIDAPKGLFVDHKDGNGLNNCKSNLRICNASQNGANRSSSLKKDGKYLGVYKVRNGLFRAASRKDKILYNAGDFKNEKDAAIAYNILAKKLHGEFANLNKL